MVPKNIFEKKIFTIFYYNNLSLNVRFSSDYQAGYDNWINVFQLNVQNGQSNY